MKQETKRCKNCRQEFTIDPEDFNFYEKMQVPPPTWCPECRQRRRYSWRNERVLYRGDCSLCKKSIVTVYSPSKPYRVYCSSCWWGDKWDPLDYGRDIDFSRPFFEQFMELQRAVPRIALYSKSSVNSEYTNHASDNKNCYLSFSTFFSEDILYSTNVWRPSKDCMDCYLANLEGGAELCYECVDSSNIYNCQYGVLLKNCRDCLYCFDCRGCSSCFLSSNLRNKQFVFQNGQLSKEEYQQRVAEYELTSYVVREKLSGDFLNLLHSSVHRFANIYKSSGVSGNVISESKNVRYAFDTEKTEDSKYIIACVEARNTMDCYHFGYNTELSYEIHSLIDSSRVLFSNNCSSSTDLQYCDSCHNSKNLFGCVGMNKGEYMILNKRYERGEYKQKRAALVEHMKQTGEYGEFFSPQCSPFGYNETQAQVYSPLAKDDALAHGWKWEEAVPGTFGKETTPPESLPDSIEEVDETIVRGVLRCVDCSKNYNVVAPELAFYHRARLPIARRCPDCRYKRRLSFRTPRALWHRNCMCMKAGHLHHPEGRCPNEFETSYAPDREEIVYCEKCYNAEVA